MSEGLIFVKGICDKCKSVRHGESPPNQVLEFKPPTGRTQSRFSYEPGRENTMEKIVTVIHLCLDCVPEKHWPKSYRDSVEHTVTPPAPPEKSNDDAKRLAEILHKKRCLGPHESTGCSFDRETSWEDPAHKHWLIQAELTIEEMSDLSVQDIIRILGST